MENKMDSIERYDRRAHAEEIENIREKVVKIEEHMERMLDVMELLELRISDLTVEIKQ